MMPCSTGPGSRASLAGWPASASSAAFFSISIESMRMDGLGKEEMDNVLLAVIARSTTIGRSSHNKTRENDRRARPTERCSAVAPYLLYRKASALRMASAALLAVPHEAQP